MALSIINKVRKGDVVAVEVEHSSTDAKMKTTYWTEYVLATVTHANREGLATRVMIAGQTHSLEAARLGKVFALVTYQTEARRLTAQMTYPGKSFATKEELRAAILATDVHEPEGVFA